MEYTENIIADTDNNFKKLKKKIKISSTAFPPNPNSESKKIQKIHSHIHKFLKKENIQIDLKNIKLREIESRDMEQIRPLFKEWFPLNYDETFYENIFLYKDHNIGNTIIAYIENPSFQKGKNSEISRKDKDNISQSDSLYSCEQLILGAIITNKENLDAFIEKVPYQYENLSYIEEISFNKKYFMYIQSLGVIDECRRIKVGSLLLNQVLKNIVADSDCLGIYLHVVVYNSAAIKFYENHNFKEYNHMYNYYFIERNHYDSKVMVRLLLEKERIPSNIINKLLSYLLINPLKALILIVTLFFCCKRFRYLSKVKTKAD